MCYIDLALNSNVFFLSMTPKDRRARVDQRGQQAMALAAVALDLGCQGMWTPALHLRSHWINRRKGISPSRVMTDQNRVWVNLSDTLNGHVQFLLAQRLQQPGALKPRWLLRKRYARSTRFRGARMRVMPSPSYRPRPRTCLCCGVQRCRRH